MKIWTLSVASMGLIVASALLTGGNSQEASCQATNTPAGLAQETNAIKAELTAESADPAAQSAEEPELANAAVQPMPAEKTLPPGVKLTAPTAEIIRLSQSGVEESVILAYVTDSTNAFVVGAEEIIYLKDIGIPDAVLAAMLERDKVLKELAAAEPGLYAPQWTEAPPPAETVQEPLPLPEDASLAYSTPVANGGGYPVFYDSLAPYGTWVNVVGWGPCWRPTVALVNPYWRPYCDGGRWVYSDCGWYWLSSYSWGWAPFHYGRWFRHNNWGWCWAPNTVWGPSWVTWRYGGSYCGWAPLPPSAGWAAGVGLTYRGHPVGSTFTFGLGISSFTFVENSHFRHRHLNRYALAPHRASQAYRNTSPSTSILHSNHRVINHGIPPSRIATATHREVQRVTINPVNGAAGRGGRSEQFEPNSRMLTVFRPRFSPSTATASASGNRPRVERNVGGSVSRVAPTTSTTAPRPEARPPAASTVVQPNAPTPSVTQPSRPTFSSQPSTISRTGSETTASSVRRDVPPRGSELIILHGSGQANRSTTGNNRAAISQPSPSRTFSGSSRTDTTPRPTVSSRPTTSFQTPRATPAPSVRTPRPAPTPSIQTPRSTPVPTPRTTIPRSSFSQRIERPTVTVRPSPARPEFRSSTVRTPQAPARTAPQVPRIAPRPSASVQAPRTIAAPKPAPQPSRSFTPPSVSSRAKPQPTVSRPAPSASPASPKTPASRSSGQSSPSSGRGRR